MEGLIDEKTNRQRDKKQKEKSLKRKDRKSKIQRDGKTEISKH